MRDLYAGIDLGRTTVACALAEWDGPIVCEAAISTQPHEGPKDVLRRRIGMFSTDAVHVVPSLLGERAGVLGAVALASRGIES